MAMYHIDAKITTVYSFWIFMTAILSGVAPLSPNENDVLNQMLESPSASAEAIAKIINEQQQREDMQRIISEQLNEVNGAKLNGKQVKDWSLLKML